MVQDAGDLHHNTPLVDLTWPSLSLDTPFPAPQHLLLNPCSIHSSAPAPLESPGWQKWWW